MLTVFNVAVWNVNEEDIPNETKNGENDHMLDMYSFDIK